MKERQLSKPPSERTNSSDSERSPELSLTPQVNPLPNSLHLLLIPPTAFQQACMYVCIVMIHWGHGYW